MHYPRSPFRRLLRSGGSLTASLFLLFGLFIVIPCAGQLPDTTVNRYATAADAAYWHNVNEGDYIFFTGNINGGRSIYAGGTVFTLSLPLGKKIVLWRGDYRRILINGVNCASTAEQPTIVTNLGGQVKWGYSEQNNTYRTLDLMNFDHLYLSGKYDPDQQTGNAAFLGHDGGNAFDSGDYYERYGLWGNPRWSGERFNGSFANIVGVRGFTTLKIDYVAATQGGFAGFNLKSDNPPDPDVVEVDVQDCFAGWTESEGFYISYSTPAAGQDLTRLTFRNNIMVFCGSEALQTDNLIDGTFIENNVALAGAAFHRRPFQDNFQDGLHQFSFCEGGVTVQNNVMINGSSLHQLRYKNPGASRVTPTATKKVILRNNYYGYSRSNICYVWQGDGITPYEISDNVYGPVSTPSTRDSYDNAQEWAAYFRLCNNNTTISITNSIFPAERPLYQGICGTAQVDTTGNAYGAAPLIEFQDAGFATEQDYRNITFWSAEYGTADKMGQFIPYEVGDIVFYYDAASVTRFYTCVLDHAGDFNPSESPAYWEELSWSSRPLPPLELRLASGSYYAERGMGLTYQVAGVLPVDYLYFRGEEVAGTGHLNWGTATERNNEKFVVERSVDGFTFIPIGEVAGRNATGEAQHYRFVDTDPPPGRNYYRLRQVDVDGSVDYGNVISLDFRDGGIVQLSPNPNHTRTFSLTCEACSTNGRRVAVFLPGGNLVTEVDLTADNTFSLSGLPTGLYFARIRMERSVQTIKLILQ